MSMDFYPVNLGNKLMAQRPRHLSSGNPLYGILGTHPTVMDIATEGKQVLDYAGGV